MKPCSRTLTRRPRRPCTRTRPRRTHPRSPQRGRPRRLTAEVEAMLEAQNAGAMLEADNASKKAKKLKVAKEAREQEVAKQARELEAKMIRLRIMRWAKEMAN